MVSIEQIEAFVMVAETGSVVTAAEKLGKTHSPVSLALKSLEARWGVLFSQDGNYRTLTKRGLALLPWAQTLVIQYKELATSERKLQQFRIGIDSLLPKAWMLELVDTLQRERLSVPLRVYRAPSNKLISQFNNNQLDWIVTLSDLPWPETANAFAIGEVALGLATGNGFAVSQTQTQTQTKGSFVVESRELLTKTQLSYLSTERAHQPVYEQFGFPVPRKVKISDPAQAKGVLDCTNSFMALAKQDIQSSDLNPLFSEEYGEASWMVLAFWSDAVIGSEVGERCMSWLRSKKVEVKSK